MSKAFSLHQKPNQLIFISTNLVRNRLLSSYATKTNFREQEPTNCVINYSALRQKHKTSTSILPSNQFHFYHGGLGRNVLSNISRNFSTSRQRRHDGDDDDRNRFEQPTHLPPLMSFPQIRFPSFKHTLRNLFFTHVLIRPYFDPHFSKADFLEGATAAVEFISKCLSSGDLKTLEESNAVTPECLRELRRTLPLLNMRQRQSLDIRKKDIMVNFIYQIGIMLDDHPEQLSDPDSKKQTRHVEITYVAQAFQNFDQLVRKDIGPIALRDTIIQQGGPTVINYRFIREYTRGVEDSWTVNVVNYFFMPQEEEVD